LTGGLGGAILTYYLKVRSEKRQRKIVSITTTEVNLSSLISSEGSAFSSHPFRFSLEGQEYDNLLIYDVTIKNIGYGGVEGLKLIVSFPETAEFLKCSYVSNPVFIEHRDSVNTIGGLKQFTYELGRIAKDDAPKFGFLFNTTEAGLVKFNARGPDGIEFLFNTQPDPAQELKIVKKVSYITLAFIGITMIIELLALIFFTRYMTP
jgi:hypothetical protein